MNLDQRIKVFSQLGKILSFFKEEIEWPGYNCGLSQDEFQSFNKLIRKVKNHNGWFTQDNVRYSLSSIAKMLREDHLVQWLSDYSIPTNSTKTVAVMMAGNIPLVGFHDFLCTLITGHKVKVKLSSTDQLLLPALAEFLITIEPEFKTYISFVPQLKEFDAVIATGSNNSALYFESYFSKYPHIIRKNRTSIAIVSGNETKEQLSGIGEDVFRYFGLGCRNVTKVYVPDGYSLDHLFEAFFPWKEITSNNKYANNYDYNKAVYLMNKIELIENGFLLLKEDEGLHSPLGVLFYEYYKNETNLREQLESQTEEIQCIVSLKDISFGEAQSPKLNDYADGVDTMAFLTSL